MCNKVGIRGGIINFFNISTPIEFCYYSHACSCPINMTTLYNFILHCIALCITGVFMSYQCLYDFSYVNMIILFAYIALHCCMYH